METERQEYIEELALLFEKLGMTRMSGRVFGYLIVNDQPQTSFEELCRELKASKGSISGTLQQLRNVGFVRPVSLPGDRKTYYRVEFIEIGEMLQVRMKFMTTLGEKLDEGRKLRKIHGDDVSRWLREFHAYSVWLTREISRMAERWEQEKDEFYKKSDL